MEMLLGADDRYIDDGVVRCGHGTEQAAEV